jgi:hypothetical protein
LALFELLHGPEVLERAIERRRDFRIPRTLESIPADMRAELRKQGYTDAKLKAALEIDEPSAPEMTEFVKRQDHRWWPAVNRPGKPGAVQSDRACDIFVISLSRY